MQLSQRAASSAWPEVCEFDAAKELRELSACCGCGQTAANAGCTLRVRLKCRLRQREAKELRECTAPAICKCVASERVLSECSLFLLCVSGLLWCICCTHPGGVRENRYHIVRLVGIYILPDFVHVCPMHAWCFCCLRPESCECGPRRCECGQKSTSCEHGQRAASVCEVGATRKLRVRLEDCGFSAARGL